MLCACLNRKRVIIETILAWLARYFSSERALLILSPFFSRYYSLAPGPNSYDTVLVKTPRHITCTYSTNKFVTDKLTYLYNKKGKTKFIYNY